MKYLLVADTTCVEDISTCCSDFGLATYLHVLKQVLNIIHLVVPIILIIMATIGLIRLMLSPDDPQKKLMKSLFNKFIAAIIIFILPTVINVLFNLFPEGFDISGCWNASEEIYNIIQDTEEYESATSKTLEKDLDKDLDKELLPSKSQSNKSNKASGSSNKTTGEKMVLYAKQFLGNPYVYGGTSLTKGTDCSGFTMRIYEKFNIKLPRTAAAQSTYSKGKKVSSISEAKPGDLFFYKNANGVVSHVTMYEGNNKVIHASNSRTGIIESDVNYRKVAIIKRFI